VLQRVNLANKHKIILFRSYYLGPFVQYCFFGFRKLRRTFKSLYSYTVLENVKTLVKNMHVMESTTWGLYGPANHHALKTKKKGQEINSENRGERGGYHGQQKNLNHITFIHVQRGWKPKTQRHIRGCWLGDEKRISLAPRFLSKHLQNHLLGLLDRV
jgi:hypothetical protein